VNDVAFEVLHSGWYRRQIEIWHVNVLFQKTISSKPAATATKIEPEVD